VTMIMPPSGMWRHVVLVRRTTVCHIPEVQISLRIPWFLDLVHRPKY
jgi:hypothetical protein